MNVSFDDGSLAGTQFADDEHLVQVFVLRVAIRVDASLNARKFEKERPEMSTGKKIKQS